MAKCECCGEREADVEIKSRIAPIVFSKLCMKEHGAVQTGIRVRARRAKLAERPSDTIPAPQEFGYEFRLGAYYNLSFPGPSVIESPIVCCISCSKPGRPIVATHGDHCAYCATRSGGLTEATKALHTERFTVTAQARARLAAFDKRNAPRPTAESRELARAHPWEMWDE